MVKPLTNYNLCWDSSVAITNVSISPNIIINPKNYKLITMTLQLSPPGTHTYHLNVLCYSALFHTVVYLVYSNQK